ncbi:hypothetical protein EV421DRAFT_1853020 [Armillaria borealis]|uniref:Phosphoglycerate kinase n=1 Tax=Armillaria borealis TaxID=47425 RepID=A0AA39IXM3_9AGAR|nr:hypothetical protein EV421DRAFT_1853020 [Armillaria borealis]
MLLPAALQIFAIFIQTVQAVKKNYAAVVQVRDCVILHLPRGYCPDSTLSGKRIPPAIHFLANDQYEFVAAIDLILDVVLSLGYPRFLITSHAGKHGREFPESSFSNGRLQ